MRIVVRNHVVIGCLLAATACGGSDGGTPPADVNTMSKNAGDAQSVAVGQSAPVAPSVRITNQTQAPVANIAVTFAVASGGGQITGGSTTTNASGVATVGSWTMGTAVGPNSMTATATGINGSPITFTATTVAGPPKTITKQVGDNQTASPGEVVAVKPAVKVVDQYGNPVGGVTVTFAAASGGGTVTGGTATTAADGVATVGNWTLGATQGANTLTATVTGAGVTGNPATFTATAQFIALNPTTSVAISGDKTYSSVNIPAGVTLTINTDAVITVIGEYTQAGVVTAPCHTLRIDAGGLLTASGNISNACTDPNADGNDLVLIGRGGYNISNNDVTSSGDIWIMDGPTLALPGFSARSSSRAGALPDVAEAGPYRCRLVNMRLVAQPLIKAKKPTKTTDGDKGSSGTSRTSGCGQLLTGQSGGNLLVDGVTMIGGTGGDGGDGQSTTSAASKGGEGGEPGALNLVSDGDIDLQGTVTLTLGNGGNGGNATSTVGAAGVAATATGGKGSGLKPRNFTSPVTIQSKRGILTIFGTLKVEFGRAGAGGTATANGGAGAPGNPGQKGGDATANGGNGGDAEAWSLNASGSIVVLGTITVTGGAGGAGGGSIRNPGAGGAGNVPAAAGGAGGNALGRGGNGGRGQPANFVAGQIPEVAATVLESPGGAGGSSTSSGGKGGDGAPSCPVGGSGGKGGDASGGGGDRGNGITAGAIATVTFNAFGNGGNGKTGNGAAGAGGTNTTTLGSGATGVAPAPGSFLPGSPGGPCPPTNVNVNLTISTPQLSQGVVTPGTYAVQLVDAATSAVVGAMNFIAQGTAFYGTSPSRIGWSGSGGSWLTDLGSATVSGAPWKFTSWRVCIINTTVSAGSPVLVEELDANQNVLAFRPMVGPETIGSGGAISARAVTSLLPCQDFVLNLLTRYIRLRMSGMSSSADANGMGGNGGPVSGPSVQKTKGG